MFCSNCGEKIEDSSSFCKNCGAKITNNDKTERVQLKCKECGGVMTADSSNKTLHCPYCGSSEVIVYGDAVEVERIRNDTYKEMEYKKWEREDEKERKAEKKKADEAYRKSGFGVVAIIGAIICGIIAMGEFSQLRYSSRLLIDAIISALQTILFVSSVLSVAKARVLLPKIIIRASKNDTNFFTTTPPQHLHELYHYNSKLAILNLEY